MVIKRNPQNPSLITKAPTFFTWTLFCIEHRIRLKPIYPLDPPTICTKAEPSRFLVARPRSLQRIEEIQDSIGKCSHRPGNS